MIPAKARQIAKQSKSIPGWVSSDATMLFAWIDQIQKRNRIRGDFFEIGCHHGKSAVLLGSMAEAGLEKLRVCDLFGQQSDNVSRSGSGDLDAFTKNLQPVRKAGVSINIFQSNSAKLCATEIGKTNRIFHVDGGHNPDEALNDLLLASQCTIDGGVIVLDDPFRNEWPGVTEALIRFLDKQPDFQAVMTGFNKLVLVRKSYSGLYLTAFDAVKQREQYGFGYPWKVKQMPFHDTDLRVFCIPDHLQRKTLGTLIRLVYHKSERIRNSRTTRLIKGIKILTDLR